MNVIPYVIAIIIPVAGLLLSIILTELINSYPKQTSKSVKGKEQ